MNAATPWIVYNKGALTLNEEDKNKNRFIVGIIVIVCILLSACYYFVCKRASADYHDVDTTVQRIEENNERARADVESATDDNRQAQQELGAGQTDVDDAKQSAGRLQDSADERARLIDEAREQAERSEQLAQRQRDLYREIEEANQQSGTSE
jgi:outer membrane murein-binding lipoprotein Lpp